MNATTIAAALGLALAAGATIAQAQTQPQPRQTQPPAQVQGRAEAPSPSPLYNAPVRSPMDAADIRNRHEGFASAKPLDNVALDSHETRPYFVNPDAVPNEGLGVPNSALPPR